jgi:murein DD-endopeptidase MepM/ murein hydrolase activator NlpD
VRAVLDGTVISAVFTADNGNVIQIQHTNNMVSVYKHNSALMKKQGDPVKAGESIAFIGNSGENSDGPHLHFELWINGIPVNPLDFIALQ